MYFLEKRNRRGKISFNSIFVKIETANKNDYPTEKIVNIDYSKSLDNTYITFLLRFLYNRKKRQNSVLQPKTVTESKILSSIFPYEVISLTFICVSWYSDALLLT